MRRGSAAGRTGAHYAYTRELRTEETLRSTLGNLVEERIDPPDTATPIRSAGEIVQAAEAQVKQLELRGW